VFTLYVCLSANAMLATDMHLIKGNNFGLDGSRCFNISGNRRQIWTNYLSRNTDERQISRI